MIYNDSCHDDELLSDILLCIESLPNSEQRILSLRKERERLIKSKMRATARFNSVAEENKKLQKEKERLSKVELIKQTLAYEQRHQKEFLSEMLFVKKELDKNFIYKAKVVFSHKQYCDAAFRRENKVELNRLRREHAKAISAAEASEKYLKDIVGFLFEDTSVYDAYGKILMRIDAAKEALDFLKDEITKQDRALFLEREITKNIKINERKLLSIKDEIAEINKAVGYIDGYLRSNEDTSSVTDGECSLLQANNF